MGKKKMLMRKFGSVAVVNNTFIGGVASVINTPALLAAKLQYYPSGAAFSENDIQNFTIVGDDIECTITAVYVILENAFADNNNIKFYNDLGGLVLGIERTSFNNCSGLQSINFNNVLNIGNSAFYNCNSLTGDLIFNSLVSVGITAFYLTNITGFTAINLLNIGGTCFRGTPITTFNAPNVEVIGSSAFYNCNSLTGDLIFNSLTSLGSYGFKQANINSFTSISLTTIADGVFHSCNLMTLIHIPNIITIGNYSFLNCLLLEGNLIFNSLVSVGLSAFQSNKITAFTAPILTSVNNTAFSSCSLLSNINMPVIENIGSSNNSEDNVFNLIALNCNITVSLAMSTINNGDIEPDILYAINSRNAIVSYI